MKHLRRRAKALAQESASVHYTRAQILNSLGEDGKSRQEFQASAELLQSFLDQLQHDPTGDLFADAHGGAQQEGSRRLSHLKRILAIMPLSSWLSR
jgi:hypothetical protein